MNPAAWFLRRMFNGEKDLRFFLKAKCPNLMGDKEGVSFERKR